MSHTQSDASPVVLDGVLTIRTIDSARATLLQALAEQAIVQVDCSAAQAVDLSFIQLLLAARRSAQRAGKSFALSAAPTGPLRAALQQGGFLPATGADPFWTAGA